jgi:FAD/FMN-containing dehydrogenase
MKIGLTPREKHKKQTLQDLRQSADIVPKNYPFTQKELAAFEASIHGKIVYPWSPKYNLDKREFNNVYPASPQMIVFVASYGDVQLCLQEAKQRGMETTIRSGRHSLADYSVCDGMVIDISGLKSVKIDPTNKTAWVQAGNTFEDLDPQLQFYKLHVPGGGCPSVSVAGYMQGGGYGLTSRTYGIQSDCVLEFTMLLADGRLVVANESQNQDLFWAVRGGTGGNFGVLLDITYQLVDLDLMWGVAIEWEFETDEGLAQAALALQVIQDYYLKGDKHPNLGIEVIIYTDIPNGSVKKVRFGGGFIGNELDFDAAIVSLLALPGAVEVYRNHDTYKTINNDILEGIPAIPANQLPSLKFYGRSAYVERSLSKEEYAEILTYFKTTVPNTFGMIDLEAYGGVINQYPVEKSSFIHRNALFDFYTIAFFDDVTNDQEANRVWINEFYEFLGKFTNGHSYQNYPNRDQEGFQWAYWGTYYNQLCVIKEKYDPDNFFHYQQSIGQPLSTESDKDQQILFDETPIIHEEY